MQNSVDYDDLPDHLSGSELEYLDRVYEVLGRDIFCEELASVLDAMNSGVPADQIAIKLKSRESSTIH